MATKSWPQEDAETVAKLWSDGWSATQISRAMGCRYSRSSILGKAMRMGLERRAATFNKKPRYPRERMPPKPKPPVIRADAPEPGVLGEPGVFPDKGCKWIVGEIKDFRCCGDKLHGNSSWCEYHAGRARQPRRPHA